MKEMEKSSGYYKLRVIFSGFSQNSFKLLTIECAASCHTSVCTEKTREVSSGLVSSRALLAFTADRLHGGCKRESYVPYLGRHSLLLF